MSFDLLLVRINAAIFVLYGAAFMLAPEAMARLVTEVAPVAGTPTIDMRATYGGMSIAAGVMLWLMAAPPGTPRLGLLGLSVVMASLALGRGYGVVVDGGATQLMIVSLAFEIALAALAAGLWWRSGGAEPAT